MSDIKIDYDKLVEKMMEKGAIAPQNNGLSMGTRLGIAIGSMGASSCYMARQVPVLGHGIDFLGDVSDGARLGYNVKKEHLHLEEARKVEEARAVQAHLKSQTQFAPSPGF